MIVTTGQRVTRSAGSAVLSLSSTISCSKLRVWISAPKLAASVFAVSISIVELMVIIIRRSSSDLSASLTRISRRSARSFTVIPSEKVMVRVMGGGAATARAPADAAARRAAARSSARRAVAGIAGGTGTHARHAGTAAGRWPAGPAATAAAAGRRAWRRCRSRAARLSDGRGPCGRARLPVAACVGRGAAGGTTRGGCGTSWRRGCSGGALGGALPGSSTRSRMLGGTKRPAAFSRATSGVSAGSAGSAVRPRPAPRRARRLVQPARRPRLDGGASAAARSTGSSATSSPAWLRRASPS